MKQSPNDHKIYKAITLDNGLRVLLIQNTDSPRAAAALAVNAGHFDDPKERQGLAHFLEHMLFLGTQKYPDSGEYQQFLSQHNGSNNAWTGTEHTCFYFDINFQHLEQALDRFSQFFIAPLLSQEFIEKERLNIDSEFKLKLKDDMRRIYDVHKETINPNHPFSKFSVGNINTLSDNSHSSLKDEVRHFFESHYLANRMTLAIEGPQTTAELQTLVEQKFSAIPTSTQPKPKVTEPLYKQDHLGMFINIKPVKSDHKLILSFAMPGIDEHYLHKPISSLGYLLGHESKGSILSYLKKRQWAMSLTAAGGVNGSNFKDFNISMRLTEEGERHIDEIVALIYSYIELIKKSGLKEVYFDEKKSISEFSFQYQEKLKPIDSVNQMVINMHHYPVEDYIYGDYVMQEFNPDILKYFLGFFTVDNMRIIQINQDLKTDRLSKWYSVPYKTSPIEPHQFDLWSSGKILEELSLPDPNPYIVKSPKVLSSTHSPKEPELILKNPGLKVWFKQDCSFFVPKGQIFIGIDSPTSVSNKKNIAMTRLFVELFSDFVLEQNYHAELAGIHYHLYPHQGGMTLQLSGINEKQPLLLENLLKSIKDHSLEKDRFDLFKRQLTRNWRNAEKSKSISQLFAKLSALMKPYSPSGSELADEMDTVEYDDFTEFCQLFFSNLSIEAFIYGNWKKPDALGMANLIDKQLSKHINKTETVNCVVLDYAGCGTTLIPLELPNHDNASVIYFPMEDNDVKTIACTMIASHLLSPHFFHQMRTEKQFGYLVGVGYVPMNRFPGIAFYIQSPKSSSLVLVDAMEEFIEQFDCKISEQEWLHLQQGLISQLQETETSPRIKSQRYWVSICNQDYTFKQKERLIETINNLSLEDILSFIKQKLSNQSNPDKICLASLSAKEQLNDYSHFDNKVIDLAQFQVELPLKY